MKSKIDTACIFLHRAASYAEMSMWSKNNQISQVEAAKEAAEKSAALLAEHLHELKEVKDGAGI